MAQELVRLALSFAAFSRYAAVNVHWSLADIARFVPGGVPDYVDKKGGWCATSRGVARIRHVESSSCLVCL